MSYTVLKDDFIFSTDKNKIDVEYVHAFLTQSYWSPGIIKEKVKRAIENSMCFGVYKKDEQIGFARVITDKTSFAYLCDVFIDEKYRGKGIGKNLIKAIIEHPELQGLRRILLTTKDAHKVYEQVGFTAFANPERFMVYNPAATKSK